MNLLRTKDIVSLNYQIYLFDLETVLFIREETGYKLNLEDICLQKVNKLFQDIFIPIKKYYLFLYI